MKVKPLIVLVVLLLSLSQYLNGQTLKEDSLALVDLYNSAGGVNWTKQTNWLTGKVSTWYGVTISEGRVSALNLSSNNLWQCFFIKINSHIKLKLAFK